MKILIENTYTAEICCAGNYELAKETCQNYCDLIGLCVTIEKCEYIYTGGNENGIKIRLVNYPRFPKENEEIIKLAMQLALLLIKKLDQQTALIITPEKTIWLNNKY